MPKYKIELGQRRDIGGIIATYFEFFKLHLKSFLNVFISYNGLFIIGFIGVSYLMVTGFAGAMRTGDEGGMSEVTSDILVGMGIVGFLGLLVLTTVLNFSLAASYLVAYDRNSSEIPDKKTVWDLSWKNLGKVLLFILLLLLIYIPVFLVSMVVGLVPFIGFFAQFFFSFAFSSWMGVSFTCMFNEDRDVTEALSEGWSLVLRHFWKSVLVNLVLSLLLWVLLMVVLMIPGFLIGVWVFHASENSIDLSESPVATVIWTLSLTLFLLLYVYMQSLLQIGNGVLYFSLREETYNINTRKRIDEIGRHA